MAPKREGRFPWLLIKNKQIACVMRLAYASIISLAGFWAPLVFLRLYDDPEDGRGGIVFLFAFPMYIFSAVVAPMAWFALRRRFKIDGSVRFSGIGALGFSLLIISISPILTCSAGILISMVRFW